MLLYICVYGSVGSFFCIYKKSAVSASKGPIQAWISSEARCPLWVFVQHHHRRFIYGSGKVNMTHTCQAGMRSKTIFRTPLLRLWTSDVLFRATCYTSLCRSVVFLSNNKWSNRKGGWPRNKGEKIRREKILTREYSFKNVWQECFNMW